MGGEVELRQLAHLLRTGTELARDVAPRREADAKEIFALVEQALAIADRLDAIAARSTGPDDATDDGGVATPLPPRR